MSSIRLPVQSGFIQEPIRSLRKRRPSILKERVFPTWPRLWILQSNGLDLYLLGGDGVGRRLCFEQCGPAAQ